MYGDNFKNTDTEVSVFFFLSCSKFNDILGGFRPRICLTFKGINHEQKTSKARFHPHRI